MARTLIIAAYICVITAIYASFAVASPVASPAASPARHAIKPAPRITVLAEGKVLAGDPKAFTGLATVDRKAVFEAIPAYQLLKREKLSRHDPRYHFLLNEANKAFNRTLDRACEHFHVDLVIQEGNVKAVGIEVIDLTPSMSRVVAQKRSSQRS